MAHAHSRGQRIEMLVDLGYKLEALEIELCGCGALRRTTDSTYFLTIEDLLYHLSLGSINGILGRGQREKLAEKFKELCLAEACQ